MEIIRREISYSEPLRLCLVSERDLSEQDLSRLGQVLAEWLQARLADGGLSLSYQPNLWLDEQPGGSRREIIVLAKWFPEDWLSPLATHLRGVFPFLQRLEIGSDFLPPPRSDAFIAVPAKTVRFEDGTVTEVASFCIAKHPVSIGEYSKFVECTGHRTVAEQHGDEYNYMAYPAIMSIPSGKTETLPAEFLSYVDALAYCDWLGARLPTESEWLAAWLLDDNVYEGDASSERFRVLSASPEALSGGGTEVTGTLVEGVPGPKVVIRRGPRYHRLPPDARRDQYFRFLANTWYGS